MKTRLILFALLTTMLFGCGSKRSGAYYDYKTQLIGSELDGSYTLLSWGKARNAADAYIQAQKQAVFDVIFNGVTGNTTNNSLKPLLFEVNAREKYETYFNTFFEDNGPWKEYCSLKEKRVLSSNYYRTDKQSLCQTTVCVYREQLRQCLINDKIIK